MRLFVAGWVHLNGFFVCRWDSAHGRSSRGFMLLVGILCCWMSTFTQLPFVLDGTQHIEDLLGNLCCLFEWKSLLLDGYIYTTSNCVRWDSAHRRSSSDSKYTG